MNRRITIVTIAAALFTLSCASASYAMGNHQGGSRGMMGGAAASASQRSGHMGGSAHQAGSGSQMGNADMATMHQSEAHKGMMGDGTAHQQSTGGNHMGSADMTTMHQSEGHQGMTDGTSGPAGGSHMGSGSNMHGDAAGSGATLTEPATIPATQ